MASPSALSRFVPPALRLTTTDAQAAVLWGVAAGSAALYLVQPFDWIKKTFFEKPAPEQN